MRRYIRVGLHLVAAGLMLALFFGLSADVAAAFLAALHTVMAFTEV